MTEKIKVENVVHPRILVWSMHAVVLSYFAVMGWCIFVTLKWILF